MEVTGPLRPILTAERTALNFLGHLSGVATLTAQFVAAAHVGNPSVAGARYAQDHAGTAALEKAAVRAGGGTNHRVGLSDAVLVKDNHLAGISITEAVAGARALWPGRRSRSSATRSTRWPRRPGPGPMRCCSTTWTRAGVVEAIGVADLDAPGPILTEVSGGVTLATIGAYAAAGPDRISVGALTHSASVLDLGLDLIWTDDGDGARRVAGTGDANAKGNG